VVRVILQKAASPPHMDGSILFTEWCQCAPPSNNASLGHPSPQPNDVSISSATFCTAYSRQSLHFPHSKLALLIWTPSNTWFPGPTRVHIPNSILIASSIFARLMIMTDRPRYSICNNSPHLHSTAMRPKFFFISFHTFSILYLFMLYVAYRK